MKKIKNVVFSIMLSFGLIGLVQAVDFAAADGSNQVVLHDVSCSAKVVALAQQMGAPKEMVFKTFEATLDNVAYKGCWAPVYRDKDDQTQGGIVVLVYEDGDIGQLDMNKFHNLKDA